MASYSYTICDMCGREIRSDLYFLELKNYSDLTNDAVNGFKCDLCKNCANRIKVFVGRTNRQIYFIPPHEQWPQLKKKEEKANEHVDQELE